MVRKRKPDLHSWSWSSRIQRKTTLFCLPQFSGYKPYKSLTFRLHEMFFSFPGTVGQGLLHIVEKFGCLLSSQLRWGISMSHAAKKGSPYFVSLEMSRALVPSATKTQKLKSWNLLKFSKVMENSFFQFWIFLVFFWMIFWQSNPQIPPIFPTFGGFGTSWAACAGASSVNLFLKDEHLGVQQPAGGEKRLENDQIQAANQDCSELGYELKCNSPSKRIVQWLDPILPNITHVISALQRWLLVPSTLDVFQNKCFWIKEISNAKNPTGPPEPRLKWRDEILPSNQGKDIAPPGKNVEKNPCLLYVQLKRNDGFKGLFQLPLPGIQSLVEFQRSSKSHLLDQRSRCHCDGHQREWGMLY